MTDQPAAPTPSAPQTAPPSTPAPSSAADRVRAAQEASDRFHTSPAVAQQEREREERRQRREDEQYRSRQRQGIEDDGAATHEAAPPADAEKFKLGDYEMTREEIAELVAHKGAMDSRRANIPPAPDGYYARLPQDFQVPQGIEYAIDPNHPLMGNAKQLMHDIDSGKVSGQAAFERILALHAANAVGEQFMFKTARDGELAKLGATGPTRIAAAETWLKGRLGPELGRHMATMIVTAKHVEGFERLMNSDTPAPRPSRSPDEAEPGKIPGFEGMSFREQRAAQDGLKGRNGRGG